MHPTRALRRVSITAVIMITAVLATSSVALATIESKPPLTKTQYVSQADALCATAGTSFTAIEQQFQKQLTGKPTRRILAALVKDLAPVVQHQITKTAALSPPKGDGATIKTILGAERAALKKVTADPTLLTRKKSPFAAADALARAFGLTGAAGAGACTGTGATTTGSGKIPASCAAIASVVGQYIGGVAHSQAFPSAPNHLSCEFANANPTSIAVVNIGQGSASSFPILRATSSGGGRTLTSISGLGAQAFSISSNGRPIGIDAITSQNVVYSVAANLPLAQNEALIKQLMKLS